MVVEFQRVAERKGCTPGQLALAWLMAQGDNILPIPGVSRPFGAVPAVFDRPLTSSLNPLSFPLLAQTKSEKYLIENFSSTDVELSAEDLKELREVIKKHAPEGDRYADESSLDN